jgi:excisionase family DNA binding protein
VLAPTAESDLQAVILGELHGKDTQIRKLFRAYAPGRLYGNTCPSRKALETRDVAAYLDVSSATVLRRWQDGSLPGYRISSNALRFDPAEVRQWLEARRG